jgi:DedD protein
MRDLERWKDKVELSLDGRQIFFLFFGSAVAACLIFVGGVLTGKRIEQRVIASAAPASEDPLAALDQLGAADADDGLTFHQALAPSERRAGRRDEPQPRPAAEPKHEEAKREPKVEPAPPPPGSGRFTLQLSAFVEKEDAEQFLQKIQSAGYHPFLVQSDVPGRGIFYRVRVGDFASRKAAADAKSDFERKQHLIAYVARL